MLPADGYEPAAPAEEEPEEEPGRRYDMPSAEHPELPAGDQASGSRGVAERGSGSRGSGDAATGDPGMSSHATGEVRIVGAMRARDLAELSGSPQGQPGLLAEDERIPTGWPGPSEAPGSLEARGPSEAPGSLEARGPSEAPGSLEARGPSEAPGEAPGPAGLPGTTPSFPGTGRDSPAGYPGAPIDTPASEPAPPLALHWTDPPTGQVPLVLLDDEGDGGSSAQGGSGPTWREYDRDWADPDAHHELLEDVTLRIGRLGTSPGGAESEIVPTFMDLDEAVEERVLAEREGWAGGDAGAAGSVTYRGAMDAPAGSLAGSYLKGDSLDGAALSADTGTKSGSSGRRHRRGSRRSKGSRKPPEPALPHEPAEPHEPALPHEPAEPPEPALPHEPAEPHEPALPHEPAEPHERALPHAPAKSHSGTKHARSHASHQPGPVRGRREVRASTRERNLPLAIVSGLVVGGAALACWIAGPLPTAVFVSVLVVVGVGEVYTALRQAGYRPAGFVGLAGAIGLMVAVYARGIEAIGPLVALVVVASLLWGLLGPVRGSPVADVSSTLFGFAWVAVLGSFGVLIVRPATFGGRHGVAYVAGAIIAAVIYDVAALAVGRMLGHRRLAPTVSPGKTWEGLLGATILTVGLSAGIVSQIHPWTVPRAVLLGVVVALAMPLGDLCESAIKRDLGLKDMSSLVPGHGGIVDRVDGLLFVLPVIYAVLELLHVR